MPYNPTAEIAIMVTEKSWAKALENKLITRMALVQRHAAYRVHKKGGRAVAQVSAAAAARESLLDGGSAANAIANGITMGMKMNGIANIVHHLSTRPGVSG